MKKKLISLLLCLTMLCGLGLTAGAASDDWSDATNRDTSWTDGAISTPEQLAQFAYLINNNQYRGDGNVWLTQDIDLDGKEWTPIGTQNVKRMFDGDFNGNGYTVKNMRMTNYFSNNDDVHRDGLFGKTSGTIRNVTVEGIVTNIGTTTQRVYLGAIAGQLNGGTVINCVGRLDVNMSLSSPSFIAGVVGQNYGGTMRLCKNEGNLNVTGSDTDLGGVVAILHGKAIVDRCENIGDLSGSAYYIGGIAAYVMEESKITNCRNTGTISGTPSMGCGGIAGYYGGVQLENCYNAGAVTTPKAGSLIGEILENAAIGGLKNLYYVEGTAAFGTYKTPSGVTADAAKDFGVPCTEAESKQADFVDRLNAGTDAFVAAEGDFPALAAMPVTFTIKATPENATIVLEKDGVKLDPQQDGSWLLLPGEYTISAEAGALYQSEQRTVKVTYDSATQSVTLSLALLPADYTAVDAALAKIPADLSRYTDESVKAVTDARDAVVRGLDITKQNEVDAMAKAIEDAIAGLVVAPTPTPAPTPAPDTGSRPATGALAAALVAAAAAVVTISSKRRRTAV